MNRLETPWENVCAAVSIIQAHVLAQDSVVSGKATFGLDYLPTDGLVTACKLLSELFGMLEEAKWDGPPPDA
ncbi:hypothetical protein D2T29_10690 [Sinirhodobacter populi]|uniref:Uncharacterized protein n=1 Tax=Paenirhodobacter populi TaxID=2306993 RepID=A0A443KFG4_9RHOB|nr:hypothetical protein [Sinirhodobacter populi]RWR31491.1 hypothetical protein D2T29_10690 [Sinirhodobacter populi]